jgi:hypothetical protein
MPSDTARDMQKISERAAGIHSTKRAFPQAISLAQPFAKRI